jgi:hypothetical protein
MAKRRTRVSPGTAAARLAKWRWHRNPARTFASLIRDGDDAVIAVVNRYISTSPSLEEAAAKINVAIGGDYKPSEILAYLKRTRGAPYRRNPKRGRRAAQSRCRVVARTTLRARINKASGGARNAVMRSILAQVMAGKVRVRGARISAAVERGIRRGRR